MVDLTALQAFGEKLLLACTSISIYDASCRILIIMVGALSCLHVALIIRRGTEFVGLCYLRHTLGSLNVFESTECLLCVMHTLLTFHSFTT